MRGSDTGKDHWFLIQKNPTVKMGFFVHVKPPPIVRGVAVGFTCFEKLRVQGLQQCDSTYRLELFDAIGSVRFLSVHGAKASDGFAFGLTCDGGHEVS